MPTVTDPTLPPPTNPEAARRTAFTDALRSLADWLDEHPEVELPHRTLRIYSSYYGAGRGVVGAAEFARAAGKVDKKVDEGLDRFVLIRSFGPLSLEWTCVRSAVCEKRTVTKTVEEWVCPDSLLREAAERADAEVAS